MSLRRFTGIAFAGCVLASAGCSAVGGGDTLTDAQQVIADMKVDAAAGAAAGLTIVGTVDRTDRGYRVGEPIVLTAEVKKPAYVAVLRVLPSGATTVILPNRAQPATQASAGTPLRITAVAESPGTVLFEFIATSRGDAWLFNRKPAGSDDYLQLGSTTRALARDIVGSVRTAGGSGTAFSHLSVRVAAR